ncbi:MAG: metal-dependent hydrolase, partial [Gammaproteobacteria bacterium]|nr:metal-dependent hydrolase [Gammaproteobacteria bacterium]
KALPLITDDKLRADVQAFIRQEAMHARAHEQATEHYLKAHGIDPDDYTRRVEYLFNEGPLADAPFGIRIPERFERDWLVFRLGFVACIEHSTCVLGNYVLDNQVWEDQGDPTVLDMLRWHGAEEVEHRCVAFDVARHLGSRYLTRFLHNAVFVPGFILVWSAGAVHIMRQDKTLKPRRPSLFRPWFWREWARSSERALVPSVPWLVKEMSRYLAWGYDPVREAHTRKAQDFFERARATGVALH